MATIRDVGQTSGGSRRDGVPRAEWDAFRQRETRLAVTEAILALSTPERIARSLSLRWTYSIGMVASHTTGVLRRKEPWRDRCNQPAGYKMMLCSKKRIRSGEEYLDLLGRTVDGFLTAAVSRNATTLRLLATAKFRVFVDSNLQALGPFVGVDNAGGCTGGEPSVRTVPPIGFRRPADMARCSSALGIPACVGRPRHSVRRTVVRFAS